MTSTDAQIKSEIARLTASINLHKSKLQAFQPRSNTYINPNYKPPPQRPPRTTYVRPDLTQAKFEQPKEIVLGGVAFHSSARSLVRKDAPNATANAPQQSDQSIGSSTYTRKSGHLIPTTRVYKHIKSRRGRGVMRSRNMTLENGRKPLHQRRAKRLKTVNKPCPSFNTTGACTRGLTCIFQHDPDKIAICWPFLQGSCPNTEDTCNLSHDPTPERTPLCVHFLNKGRCTREKCPFPHVNVGSRQGVCRDFAVLGYCEKGLDCEHQHVRECPDFAATGACSHKGCKLPHVIRANRNKKASGPSTGPMAVTSPPAAASSAASETSGAQVNPETAEIGDEYVPLTFNEDDISSESDEEEEDGDEEEDEDEDAAGNDIGPPQVDDIMVHS